MKIPIVLHGLATGALICTGIFYSSALAGLIGLLMFIHGVGYFVTIRISNNNDR